MKRSISFITAALIAICGILAFMYVVGKNGIKLEEFKPCEFLKSCCRKKKAEEEEAEDED